MDVVASIRSALEVGGDPERALQQQAYMKSALPFRGFTSPQLKALLRPILGAWEPTRVEWEGSVRALWDAAAFREELYGAIALVRHRAARGWLALSAVPLLEHLITTGAWWDVVDELSTHPLQEVLASYPAEMGELLRDWSVGEDLWLRRASIISQVGRRAATSPDLLADVIEPNLADTSFWIRKAIGWSLRDHARTDPAWVRARVAAWDGRLSGLSRREALKHLG